MWLEKSESVLPSVSRGYAQGDAVRPLCLAQRPPSGGRGPSPWRPRDQSRNLAFSGNRPALSCKRDMQTRRQGGWGEALLGEATAIQKVVIPDQGATSESSF